METITSRNLKVNSVVDTSPTNGDISGLGNNCCLKFPCNIIWSSRKYWQQVSQWPPVSRCGKVFIWNTYHGTKATSLKTDCRIED